VAAVADWRPETVAVSKVKKQGGKPAPIALVETPDILAKLSKDERRPRLVVGFAAETDDVEAHAQAKLAKKGCDWIVANDVSIAGTMGGEENAVAIVTAKGVERWPRAPKAEVARKLAQKIADQLAKARHK
jgi:phosphopantothenoylcysteine decarboxylase/phosphopantothenate--cysteine ligase